MVNSDNGIALGNKLVASIAREHCCLQRNADDLLLLIANTAGTPAALEKYGQLRR